MSKLFYIAIAALIITGCAQQFVLVRESRYRSFAIQPVDVSAVRAGTVLFVNASPGVWQRCLVFDGYYGFDQLIRSGPDGMPELMVRPVGYFEIGPAENSSQPAMGEKLVGFFKPNSGYTVLAVAEDAFNGLLGVGVVSFNEPGRAMGEQYHYWSTLGRYTSKTVNCLVYLPSVSGYRQSNDFHIDIDLNQLLWRWIRSTANPQ